MTIKVTYNVTDVYMTQSVSPVYINVSYPTGGTSGGGTWGTITGTLSNQTDLQNALNLKVPYTGATANVDLGEYELKAGQVTLDTTPTGTAAVGTTRWNDTTGTSETTLKGGSVVLKNGVDLVARVVNKVTPNTTLTKAAYQAVRVSGAQGQRLAVALAQANNDANSADTIGLVTETIATNQEGFIMTVGQLEGINTTGSLQGETWVDGDVLYLSPTTAGALTNIKPTGAGHIVVIGYVEYAHANNGKIYTKVMNGWELDELHDVDIISPANNEALIYESSSALWKNKTIATALGYTPANAATTLTINGVTYDLSTSRTWTIAAGISGSGASGQVTYWTGALAVSGSNNLFWDNANGRLGIGTNAPAQPLHISGSGASAAGRTWIRIQNTSANSAAGVQLMNASNRTASIQYAANGYGTGEALSFFTDNDYPILFGTNGVAVSGGAAYIAFSAGGYLNEAMRVTGTKNLLIGTTTDGGQRLQVIGDTLLRGSGATSATTALTVQNSSSTNLFSVRNDGRVGIGIANPAYELDAIGSFYFTKNQDAQTFGIIRNTNNSANAGVYMGFIVDTTSGSATFGKYSTSTTAFGIIQPSDFYVFNNTRGDIAFANGFASGRIKFAAGGSSTAHVTIKTGGQVRFHPLASAPAGAEAGDVYYNSTDNKHYGYNGTTWNAFY